MATYGIGFGSIRYEMKGRVSKAPEVTLKSKVPLRSGREPLDSIHTAKKKHNKILVLFFGEAKQRWLDL